MKSSTGKYYLALDQIRGLAAFLVFTWHFIAIQRTNISGFSSFPLNIFTEGHTGVALFMVLSGYLFAKLLNNKQIIYSKFIWNRLIRLLPILLVVICIVGVIRYFEDQSLLSYFKSVIKGIVKPTLPNGGWSITVEFHFYILLPLLLFFNRKWKYSLVVALILAIFLRTLIYQKLGQIQFYSYWTIIGRIDQFLLGILAFNFKNIIKTKHLLAITIIGLFFAFYYFFDRHGGFYDFNSDLLSKSIWIIIPTVEGIAYAFFIAWYDNSFNHSNSIFGKLLANAGKYSYSIYLLHFFVVLKMATFIDHNIVDLSNIYVALLFSIPCFLLMIPIGYLSFKYIESPFLKYRTKYIKDRTSNDI